MGSLLLLPNKILALIAGTVDRKDIENFALSCKKLFNSPTVALQLHRRRKRFTNTAIVSPTSPGSIPEPTFFARGWASHPLWLLRTMLEDPEVGKYVETLKITRQEIKGLTHPLADLADPEPSFTTESQHYLQIFHTYFNGLKAQSSFHCGRVQSLLSDSRFYLKENIVPLWRDGLLGKRPQKQPPYWFCCNFQNSGS